LDPKFRGRLSHHPLCGDSLGGSAEVGDLDVLGRAVLGEGHVDGHDRVLDSDSDLILGIIVGGSLEGDTVLSERIVRAVAIDVKVVNDNVTSVEVVGLVSAGEVNNSGDGEVHGGVGVDLDISLDLLTKHSLAASVGSGRGSGDGDDSLELSSLVKDKVDGENGVLDRHGDLVLGIIVGHPLKCHPILSKGVVGAISVLIDVINGDVGATESVGLIGAGEVNDPRDGEVHGGVRVDTDEGVDGLAEDSLGSRVSSGGGSSKGGGEGDGDDGVEGRGLGEDEVNGEDRVLHGDGNGVGRLIIDCLLKLDVVLKEKRGDDG